jgi:magnesium chelatase family protein
MIVEVPRENIETIMEKQKGVSSKDIKKKVETARNTQQKRFAEMSLTANAQMSSHHLQRYVPLDKESEVFIKKAANRLHLSARVVHRTIKLARTIADVAGTKKVTVQHIAEAIQYRSKSMLIDS